MKKATSPYIAIILGTRPEIIKFSPVIRELQKRNARLCIIHTNQHYSENMDKVFLEELQLPQPKYNLGISARTHGRMVGQMLVKIESILLKEKPDWVLVQGDTNTVLAGALAAAKIPIKLGHIEAGLRSYDRTMPEELNRVAADHLANTLFCPTEVQRKILVEKEGLDPKSVYTTGNTIVDALQQNLKLALERPTLQHYQQENYFLVTMHRPANVDHKEQLTRQIANLEKIAAKYGMPIYYPIHPRAEKQLATFQINPDPTVLKIIPPVDYLEMLMLMSNAKVILTDSGGIQEEACILKIPCITLRENTERPETLTIGANILVGSDYKTLEAAVDKLLHSNHDWSQPYGDGTAAEQIVSVILNQDN